MPITLDAIILEVNDLAAKRDAADTAHAATIAALTSVVAAQADASAKAAAQSTAEETEQSVFDQLLADLQSFKSGQ
jgi:hypothetical protein